MNPIYPDDPRIIKALLADQAEWARGVADTSYERAQAHVSAGQRWAQRLACLLVTLGGRLIRAGLPQYPQARATLR